MTTKHKVLLIGSGLMTPPLIDYLLSFNDTHISVVSNLVEDARALAKKAPKFMDADFLDVTDVSKSLLIIWIFFSKLLSQKKLKATAW